MTKDNAIQIITGADGAPSFAAVPIETYRSMVRDLDAYRDLKTGMRELQAFDDGIAGIPADVAHRIADGENPVRVWRDHRGLKAVALARKAGISPAYLSEIETGKKEGTFRTMAALARHLEISLDDLAPLADDQDAVSVRRAGREAALKVEIAGIRATIASGAFDSGAVRGAVKRLKADMDALVADGAEPIWARDLASALEQIVQLHIADITIEHVRRRPGKLIRRKIKVGDFDVLAPAPVRLHLVGQQGNIAGRDALVAPAADALPGHG